MMHGEMPDDGPCEDICPDEVLVSSESESDESGSNVMPESKRAKCSHAVACAESDRIETSKPCLSAAAPTATSTSSTEPASIPAALSDPEFLARQTGLSVELMQRLDVIRISLASTKKKDKDFLASYCRQTKKQYKKVSG